MASTMVVLTCAVADGFLLYLLVQFTRELRKGRSARAISAAIPLVMAARKKEAEDHEHRKVIDITSGSYESSQNPSRRRASDRGERQRQVGVAQ